MHATLVAKTIFFLTNKLVVMHDIFILITVSIIFLFFLLLSQIKKTIRKKHILPAYKLRYKPFFVKPDPPGIHDEVLVENSKLTVGTMQITVVECGRLPFSKENEDTDVYCSLSIGMFVRLFVHIFNQSRTFEIQHRSQTPIAPKFIFLHFDWFLTS